MTYDSPTGTGQAHLTDAFLWLVGAPLTVLDILYLSCAAPPITPNAPETLAVWTLACLALALLAWNLLWSAVAHLATLTLTPAPLRRASHALVSRVGTRLSKSLLAKAGAGALIGSALLTPIPHGASMAAPPEAASPGISLTWADSPNPSLSTSDATSIHPDETPSTQAQRASREATAAQQTVTIRPGDTLWSIAQTLRPDSDDAHITRVWQAIHRANADAIPNPSLIYPGVQLSIPQDLP